MTTYPNPLMTPINLGRYNRILINVLHAVNLPPQQNFHVVLKINDATHTTQKSTKGPNAYWESEEFTAPLCYGSFLELSIFHEEELLGQLRASVNRMISFDGPPTPRTLTLRLRNPNISREDPMQYTSSITLYATRLPTFVAEAFQPYHLPSIFLVTPPFNVAADDVERILGAMKRSDVPNIASLGESLVVKFGRRVSTREAMAMLHIQQRTSIPTPKVHQCFQRDNVTYIVMDRVKGQPLEDCVTSLTAEQLRTIAIQLAGFVQQLKALDARPLMGSWPSGPYDNPFFDPAPLREFNDMKEFHSYWIWRLGSYMGLPEVPSALCDGRPCNVVLTHGDLAARNIMVDNGEITGILDWETLGWYPDFWELMAATRGAITPWRNELILALGPECESSQQYPRVLHDIFSRRMIP
ncbi:hypothetical protein M413DRAFT_441655 [Hebeloma cylindrosporum]|uniref:C2 domain-containing protein n=1 Tax=Hebeloma cylindrosporum TaxID=76867 RepID=A0A0C3CR51_HEBCY|nr:hypothetical protein M413DRAFT_441655 [Hebeloma cylindrosporum h7]